MVGQKDCGEQQCSKVNTPEKDIDLKPGSVKAGDEHDHRKDEPENLTPRGFTQLRHEESSIKVRAIDNREPHVEQKEAKVSVITMTNTIPNKHAVVFPF